MGVHSGAGTIGYEFLRRADGVNYDREPLLLIGSGSGVPLSDVSELLVLVPDQGWMPMTRPAAGWGQTLRRWVGCEAMVVAPIGAAVDLVA